jgi:dihydropteroate synthase
VLIDPGFGFGKTVEHNLTLLRRLAELTRADAALLVGLSRKGLLGTLTGRPVSERSAGSVALAVLAAQRGARIIRAHDVAATLDALKVVAAVTGGG